VTRLGEISPIWWLFSSGSFLKIIQVAQIYVRFLFKRFSPVFIATKKRVGLHFGRLSLQTHLVTLILLLLSYQIFVKRKTPVEMNRSNFLHVED
jgi:hypothetical protein